MNKKILFLSLLLIIQWVALVDLGAHNLNSLSYIQEKLIHDATPYVLPNNHPLKPIMDSLFSSRDVIKEEEQLAKAGFITLKAQKTSGIRIVKHAKLKGHIIKLYLDSQEHHRLAYSQQDWLIQRCRGAALIKEIIKNNRLQDFTVPNKWLYKLPQQAIEITEPTYVILETYMPLVRKNETILAWKEKATKRTLKELFMIMRLGGASGSLVINTPYTKEGKFTFIDTEYPDRIFQKEKLSKVSQFFSPENQLYWSSLINNI
jgi:leucyl-tRNA synthetase